MRWNRFFRHGAWAAAGVLVGVASLGLGYLSWKNPVTPEGDKLIAYRFNPMPIDKAHAGEATGPFAIQVGAFAREAQAKTYLDGMVTSVPAMRDHPALVIPLARQNGILHRALFTGFASEAAAAAACKDVIAMAKSVCDVRRLD